MTVDERTEAALRARLDELLGVPLQEALMEMVGASGTGALRSEMAELRGEMADLRGELRGEMAELRGEMAELHTELRVEVANQFGGVYLELARHTRTLVVAIVGAMVTSSGLAYAAASFS